MRTFICLFALLAAHPAAGGQPGRAALQAPHLAQYTGSWSRPDGRRLSGGNCASDRAEPVWGPRSELLGYACVPESANGG